MPTLNSVGLYGDTQISFSHLLCSSLTFHAVEEAIWHVSGPESISEKLSAY